MSEPRTCPHCGDTFAPNRFNAHNSETGRTYESALWRNYTVHVDRCKDATEATRRRLRRARERKRGLGGHFPA